jgi:hypothetical protein
VQSGSTILSLVCSICGVPQGSEFEPKLSVLYIADLTAPMKNSV